MTSGDTFFKANDQIVHKTNQASAVQEVSIKAQYWGACDFDTFPLWGMEFFIAWFFIALPENNSF